MLVHVCHFDAARHAFACYALGFSLRRLLHYCLLPFLRERDTPSEAYRAVALLAYMSICRRAYAPRRMQFACRGAPCCVRGFYFVTLIAQRVHYYLYILWRAL